MLALLIQEVAILATAQDNLARKQLYIPALQPEAVTLRVAAYCRVSSDSDDQLNSFDAQQNHYYEYINYLMKNNVKDIMTGYRAFSYEFVKGFPVLSKGFEIETEMTIHAVDKNFKIVQGSSAKR